MPQPAHDRALEAEQNAPPSEHVMPAQAMAPELVAAAVTPGLVAEVVAFALASELPRLRPVGEPEHPVVAAAAAAPGSVAEEFGAQDGRRDEAAAASGAGYRSPRGTHRRARSTPRTAFRQLRKKKGI
jgi:hypothetical protein